MGISEEEIRRRGKENSISQARSLAAYLGNKELGITRSELAKYFGIAPPSMSESILRGEKIQQGKGITLLPTSVP